MDQGLPFKTLESNSLLLQGLSDSRDERSFFEKMIVVRTIITVLPEKQKEVLQTLFSLIAQLGKEKGCLSYDIYSDIVDENVFSLISDWKNRQFLDNHLRSDRFSVLLGIKSLLREPLKFQILTVSNSEGAEAVNFVRKKDTDFPDDNTNRGCGRTNGD